MAALLVKPVKQVRLFGVFCLALLALPAFGQLRSLQFGASTGTATLSSYPLGTFQWAFRVHGLPSSTSGSNITFIDINSGTQVCRIPANTLQIQCFDSFDAGILGGPIVSFSGLTDIRMVVTRTQDATYGTTQLDLWKSDCTSHTYSRMPEPYQGGEPANTSGPLALGGSSLALGFFRSTSTPVSASSPTCPPDAPSAISPNSDFRFEGNTLTDVSGHAYTLSVAGSSFINSPLFNPAAIITGSWTAPRPVVALAAFTLDGSKSVTSLTNGVPASYLWSQTAGPAASSFSSTTVANPTVTPPQDGSYTYQLVATDANANTGTTTVDVGVVQSDSNGLKVFSDASLAYVLGPLPRYGVNPWPWYDFTEADTMDVLYPYWTAPPAPGTLFTGSGLNDAYFTGRGAFTGAATDTYDVKISATGATDSYQWRKNGGAYSASIAITAGGTGKDDSTVTDGVVIQFTAITGHTMNDVWTRQAPYTGTASISGASPNTIDGTTGYVCGPTCGTPITVVGTGTTWSSGTATQKLVVGDVVWLEWDADGAASRTGRWFDTVVAIQDNTHFTINGSGGFWSPPIGSSSSMYVQKVGADLTGYTQVAQPSASWNYYEALLGGIRLAAATNLSLYDTQSQAFCNLWWQYGLDHGYRGTIQRNAGYQSMMACAVKYGYNWWDGIARVIGVNSPSSPVARDAGTDIREYSYTTRATALMAHLYPSHTVSPATTRTTWCGYLANQITNYWLNPSGSSGIYTLANSGQDAYFQENLCTENCGYPASGNPPGSPTTAVFGTSPWRDSGLSGIALIEAQKSLFNTSDCNNASAATSVSSAINKSASFIWDYGRSSDGGLYYNVQYLSMQGVTAGDVIHNRPDTYDYPTQSVTVTGGTAVTGTGNTYFTKAFAPCNGTVQIVINNGSPATLASCTDDTHLTLAAPITNASGASYYSAGTIAVTNGSATVVGTRTGFTTLFAPCNGTTYIGIRGTVSFPYTTNAVYRVTACADNTHLTLNVVYAGTTNASISDFSLSKQSTTSCSPSISTNCEADSSSGRNLAADYPVSLSWNLLNLGLTGSGLWRPRAQYAIGKLYGGADGGPGTLGAATSPGADGTVGNFDGIMPACVTSPTQPCTFSLNGGSLQYGHGAKEFGMSAGAGNARNAIANYLVQQPGIRVRSISSN